MSTSPDSILAAPWAGLGLDLFVKSGLLIAAALAARRCFGRRPLIASAAGHACLIGLLALPLSSRFGPPVVVRLPRAEAGAPAPPRPSDPAPIAEARTPDVDPFDAMADRAWAPAEGPKPAAVTIASGLRKVQAPLLSAAPERPEPPRATDWAAVAAWAYLAIASGLLARLAFALGAVGRLARSSVAVDDPAWLEPLARIKGRLGIGREVALAWSSRVGVPVVIGWLRPTILLPAEGAEGVEAAHVEPILLHELAHIRRGDYAWNVLAKGVEALYWPQPLAWLLARAVAESRELACDSFCVGQLGGPATYREALIAMAEGLIRRPGPALGLAIAGRSRLARRVAEIDRGPGESRCLSARPTRFALAALALIAAVPLGPARLTRAEPRATPPPLAAEPKPAAPIQAPAPAPAPVPGVGRVFRLRVVAAGSGQPVPRATVRLWMAFHEDDWRSTDEEGRIDIVHSTGPSDRGFGLDLWGDGFAEQRHRWGLDPKVPIPDEATVALHPGESLGGFVLDEQGRPVAGASVYLFSYKHRRKVDAELLYDLRSVTSPDGRWQTGGAPRTTGDLFGFYITHPDFLSDRGYLGREKPPIADLRAGNAVSVLKKGVPITGRVVDAGGRAVPGALVISTDRPDFVFNGLEKHAVRADADGNFRTGQVNAGAWHLVIKAPGHGPGAAEVKVGSAVPWVEVRLPKPAQFRARVVDPDGRPIEGAFINVDTWQRYRCLGVYLYSDADGKVRWDDAPVDPLHLNVDRLGYRGLFDINAQAGPEEVSITLRPSLSISGNVSDAETNKLVDPAVFEYGAIDPKTGEVALWEKPPALGWTILHDGVLNANFPVSDQSDKYRFRITAEGYVPFVSRVFDRSEKVVRDYHVKLVPGSPDGPRAVAIRPDGRPLAGAVVLRIWADDGRGEREPRPDVRAISTGADGTFTIPQGAGGDVVVIRGDDCYGSATVESLARLPAVQTRPYGRIEGRYLVGTRPAANRPIGLEGMIRFGPARTRTYYVNVKATTDAEGRFAFEKVIPMPNLRVRPDFTPINRSWASSSGEAVRVEDGRTTAITLGGRGRAVIGRAVPPEGWDRTIDFTDRSGVNIHTEDTWMPVPFNLLRGRTSLEQSGWSEWMLSNPATAEDHARSNARVDLRFALAPDGSFRVDDVPPGEYRVAVRVNDEAYRRDHGPFAVISRTVVIPAGRSDEPLDLGDLRLRPRVVLKAGDPAPRVEVVTTEGKALKIPDDFRGKFLLLDFGTLWDDQSRLQVVRMNGVFARFGKDERFALLSLLLAADRPDARRFVAEKGEPWPQAIVGPLSNPLASAYGVGDDEVPATVLIGPNGRVIATDTRNFHGEEAIARAMGLPERPAPAPRPRPKGEAPPRDPMSIK